MITPHRAGDALLLDIRAAAMDSDYLHLWWLGQSGFLAQWKGACVLFDPYLSNSLTRKYAETNRPHVRMTQIPIAPELLEFVQIITVSHHHTDHLDPDTLQALVRANPKTVLIGPAAHAALVQERSGLPQNQIHLLDAGASWEMNGVQFHAVPAAHETVEKDEQGRCKFLGFVAQFGKWSVYHSGDTVYYEGMLEWLAEWKIDVAILPINGRAPERGVAGNLWGCEAAKLASDIGARLAIPCHYDMFTFNTVSTDDFRDAAMKLKQPFRILQCGEHWCSKSLV